MKWIRKVLDLLVGVPLMALSVWPVRLRRRIAGGRVDGRVYFLRTLASILFIVVYYAMVVEVVARGVALARGRTTTPPWRYVDDRFLYAFHPFRAFETRPNAVVKQGTAGYHRIGVEYYINEFGARGPALAPKGSGKPRIICMGGSVTFGGGVPEQDTWPARLAKLVPEWSVMNAGVTGYTSRHILAYAQGSLFDLEPDLLIVLTGRNDLHCNESFHPDRFRADYAHMHGVRDEPEGLRKWLIRNTWFYCTLARWRQGIKSGLGRVMRRKGPPVPEMGPRGIGAFRRNIEDLLALAKRRNIPVLLLSEAPGYLPLTMPDGSANPHLWHLDRDAPGCAPDVYTRGLEAYGDQLAATGAPYIDLVREMPRDPALFVDSIHMSGKGGEETARRIVPVARKLLEARR